MDCGSLETKLLISWAVWLGGFKDPWTLITLPGRGESKGGHRSHVLEKRTSFWLWRQPGNTVTGEALLWACAGGWQPVGFLGSLLKFLWGGHWGPAHAAVQASLLRKGKTESPGQGPIWRPDLPPNWELGWGRWVFGAGPDPAETSGENRWGRERTPSGWTQASHPCCSQVTAEAGVGAGRSLESTEVGGSASDASRQLSRTGPHPLETVGH